MYARLLLLVTMIAAVAATNGCATAKNDTTGFAVQHQVVLDEGYAEAWQHVKRTLVAEELEVYTRDKRGTFVAYQGGKPFLGVLNSPRKKYTLDLEPVSNTQTKVDIEVVKQVYGTSLTTYPDWHDRQTKDDDTIQALIAALTGAPAEVAAPAEAEAVVEDAAAEAAPAEEAVPAEEAAPVEEAAGV